MLLILGLIVSSISVLAVPTLIAWVRRALKWKALVKAVGGPPGLPFLGNFADVAGKSTEDVGKLLMFDWPQDFGPRFAFSLGNHRYFASFKHEDIEKLLNSTTQISKGWEYKLFRDWLRDGLLLSTGSKWRKRRKALTAAFHFKILEDFMPIYNRNANVFVKILGAKSTPGDFFDIEPLVTFCALDVICETAMGVAMGIQTNANSLYTEAATKLAELKIDRYVTPWMHPDFIWKLSPSGREEKHYVDVVHKQTLKIIQDRKDEMMRGLQTDEEPEDGVRFGVKKRPKAFLDLLLEYQRENPDELSDQDVLDETEVFMFAGHDTAAANIKWTLRCLGECPEQQKRVKEELDAIFGSDRDRDVTSEDLAKMRYWDMCIKESMRLYPSVPYIGRELSEDLQLSDGLVVPKGTLYAFFIIALHRNPEVYPEPAVFKPERFTTENSKARHPFAYLPFSAGPRNCIVQKFAMTEIKVVLAKIFLKYSLTISPTSPVRPIPRAVLRNVGGVKFAHLLRFFNWCKFSDSSSSV